MGKRRRSPADRAKNIDMAVGRMVRPGAGIGRGGGRHRRDQATGDDLAVSRVEMAEGQRKVDGEREQRKPRSLPDIVPKPAHAAFVAIVLLILYCCCRVELPLLFYLR